PLLQAKNGRGGNVGGTMPGAGPDRQHIALGLAFDDPAHDGFASACAGIKTPIVKVEREAACAAAFLKTGTARYAALRGGYEGNRTDHNGNGCLVRIASLGRI